MDRNGRVGVFGEWLWWSLPARGAWIEIFSTSMSSTAAMVAPREGSVDRNYSQLAEPGQNKRVAPREGSVDRNHYRHSGGKVVVVAPREGSVDRNKVKRARRAKKEVAPREGSVDRNQLCLLNGRYLSKSLPARGAWIEISKLTQSCLVRPKSLPARGAWIEIRTDIKKAGWL